MQSEHDETLDIQSFKHACGRYLRCTLVVAIATMGAMGACFAVMLTFKEPIKSAYVEWVGESTAEVLVGLTPLPAVLVMAVGFAWLQRMANQLPQLRCPHCNGSLIGNQAIVIATRNCTHCGRRVVTEPKESK